MEGSRIPFLRRASATIATILLFAGPGSLVSPTDSLACAEMTSEQMLLDAGGHPAEVLHRVEADCPSEVVPPGSVVRVAILVDSDGRVKDAKVVRSPPGRDSCVLAAVRRWTFAPGRTASGRPVASWIRADVSFAQKEEPERHASHAATPSDFESAAKAGFERSRHLLLDVRPFEFTAWKRELESVHRTDVAFDGAIAWECRRCAILFADSLPADSILQVIETAVLLREPMAMDDSLVAICDRLGRQPPAMRIARENSALAREKEAEPRFGDYVRVDELPESITKVAPEYPEAARKANVQGTVLMQVLVGKEGRVHDVRVVKSVPALDDAAITAVRQWVFKAGLTKGRPVAVWVAVPMKFTLN